MESEKLCFTTKHCSKSPKTNFYGPNMTQLICGGSHHALSFFLSLSRSVARNEYLIPAVWHEFFSPITCHTSSYIYFKMLFFCVWISLSFLIDPSESAAGRQQASQPANKQAGEQARQPASKQASQPASKQGSQQASKPASQQASE